MKFYHSIACYYDDIFPYNPVQKKFIILSVKGHFREMYLMDIGCGTGNLSLELSKNFKQVMGIDLDLDMLGKAKLKIKGYGNNIKFKRLNMLDIGKNFPPSSFHVIICFGNTLPHLDGLMEIQSFLTQCRRILKPGGKLLIQMVNYDRILKRQIGHLPLIENGRVRFERIYRYNQKTGKIDFKTILTIKESGRVIENITQLYPILKNEMESVMKAAEFRDISFYGSFARDIVTDDSVPLVIEAI